MFKSLFQEVVRGLEMTATSSLCQQLSTVFSGGVSNFNQSEARKHCFLASGWLKFETSPENTALYIEYEIIGEGSQISTNQKPGNSAFSLLIG